MSSPVDEPGPVDIPAGPVQAEPGIIVVGDVVALPDYIAQEEGVVVAPESLVKGSDAFVAGYTDGQGSLLDTELTLVQVETERRGPVIMVIRTKDLRRSE